MKAAASSGAVMASSHRGICRAFFALLPALLVAALMLLEPNAYAGSSVLEIEPPSLEDSRHPSAAPDHRLSNRDTKQGCESKKGDDDSESNDSRDDASSAQKSASADSDEASADDDDDNSAAAGNSQEDAADSKQDSDCAQADSDSAKSDDADDDSGNDVEPASAYENRPSLETRIDHATDSDHNDTVTTTTIASALIKDFAVGLRRDSVAAHDQFGSERLESTVFSIHKDLTETFGIGGGFGTVRTDGWSDFVGSLQGTAKVLNIDLTATIARDILVSQADAIRNHIRQTDFGLSASYELTKQIGTEFEVHHKLYSDQNSSNEFEWTPKYTFDFGHSKLETGYKFGYTAFAQNTDHGYWAPERVLSHNLFAAWAFDFVKTYGRLELSGGRDFVRERGAQSSGPSSGGFGVSASGAIGFRLTEDMVIEGYVNRDESAGWQSMATGISLKYFY
jgi:hypothetical protein